MFRLSISQSVALVITQSVSQSVSLSSFLFVSESIFFSIHLSLTVYQFTHLQFLLVSNTESLLLVYDQQSEIRETHCWLEQCVCAHNYLHNWGRGGEREGAGY
jgi:hypothetical protein